MSDSNLEFARGGAELTVELLEKLKAATDKGNVIISPFSIQTCMALSFAGAKGATAEEISTVMKYGSNSTTEVAAAFKSVLDKYKDSELLKIANKLYVQAGSSIKAEYATVTREQYHAEAESIDFAESEIAAKTINNWVEYKTAGKIQNLIPSDVLSPDTGLILLNALHFKGEWLWKFDKARTKEDDFWVNPEESVKVQYMSQKSTFGYRHLRDYNCSALEMPYKDSDLSMFVLKPNEGIELQTVMEQLKNVNLLDLSEQMRSTELIVHFPKFQIKYSVEMSTTLQEMGITKAFNSSADFSNILENAEKMCISEVFHQTSIEVNEEGSEVSAASATRMRMRCRQLEFIANRPFMYWIWNKKNILFAGAFVNPLAES